MYKLIDFVQLQQRKKKRILLGMNIQNLQNSRLFAHYRQDEMNRLKRKIGDIKTRKNQHIFYSNKIVLPLVKRSSGFSTQRLHQIQTQNTRLVKRIQKTKLSHSSYFYDKMQRQKSSLYNKQNTKENNIKTSEITKIPLNLPLLNMKSSKSQIINPLLLGLKEQKNTNRTDKFHEQQTCFRRQLIQIYFSTIKKPKTLRN